MTQAKSTVIRQRRQSSVNDQVRPEKKLSLTSIRKSARQLQSPCRQLKRLGQVHQLPSPISHTPGIEPKPSRDSSSLLKRPKLDRKRKRNQPEEDAPRFKKEDHKKRPKNSSELAVEGSLGSEFHIDVNPIEYWSREYTWPKRYFEGVFDEMSQPLTRKRSSSMRSQEIQSSKGTPNDLSREAKSAPYKDARYESVLATNEAFMDESDTVVSDDCKALYKQLLKKPQELPSNTLFRDDLFKRIHQKIRNENEAMVIQDIGRLIVPSAENLAIYEGRASNLKILKEKVNSSWLKCLPLTSPRPQPDYSVGFKASAFTKDQLNRLSPFVGEYMDQCSVMAREDMYFPFLSCEVKCGDQGLNVADRQNMHSASVSVKGIVDLFRRVKRQKELHRTILAFSVSHDNEAVRIYGHYALLDGDGACFYRHAIKKFDITSEEGKEKWTAYKFTRNVYDIFVPIHLNRICSVVDQLPDPAVFNVQPSTTFVSNPERDEEDGIETEPSGSQRTSDVIANTPDPVSSQTTAPAFKKPRG